MSRRKRNPTEMIWWFLGLGGAAVAVGAVVYVATGSSAAAASKPTVPGPTTLPSGQGAVAVLQPGVDTYSANLSAQGGMLTVTLPAGATIAAGGTSVAVPANGTTSTAGYTVVNPDGSATSVAPVTSAFTTGNNTLTITWTDAAFVSHTSQVNVSVAM